MLENLKDLKDHYENIHDIEETSLVDTVENAEQILAKLENKLALKVKNPQFESKMNQISQLQDRVASLDVKIRFSVHPPINYH